MSQLPDPIPTTRSQGVLERSRWVRAVVLGLVCGGCQGHWPPAGTGGMAEQLWPAFPPTPPPPALTWHLSCSLDRLSAIRTASDRAGLYGGKLRLLDEQAARAQREYAGGLFEDSNRTLSALDSNVSQLRAEMKIPVPAPVECA